MVIKIGASALSIRSHYDLFIRGLQSFTTSESVIHSTVIEYANNHAVFVGYGDHGPLSFCILFLPEPGGIEQIPQVLHFHSEGSRKETRELVSAVLDFVRKSGYNTLRAVNGSGRRDEVWLRVFRHNDWNIKPVKTVYDFEVK